MLVMLRLTPFVAHLMLVMILNLLAQCSFQDLLFLPKSAEKSASKMDITLPVIGSDRRWDLLRFTCVTTNHANKLARVSAQNSRYEFATLQLSCRSPLISYDDSVDTLQSQIQCNKVELYPGLSCLLPLVWCPCVAILPVFVLLTLCYYHRGTRSKATKRFCLCNLCSHLLNVLTTYPAVWGILGRFRCVRNFL